VGGLLVVAGVAGGRSGSGCGFEGSIHKTLNFPELQLASIYTHSPYGFLPALKANWLFNTLELPAADGV